MSNIYELGQGFETIWEMIEGEGIEESVIEEAFLNLKEDLAYKFENCCKYIINENAILDGLKAEKKRIDERITAKENAIKRLKKVMKEAMDKAGEKNLPCGSFTVYIQNNPKSLVLDQTDIQYIPDKYLKVKAPEIDIKAIKEALEKGTDAEKQALEGVAHLKQDASLRIR